MNRRAVATVLVVLAALISTNRPAAAAPPFPWCGDNITHSLVLTHDVGNRLSPCAEDGLDITGSGITLDLNGHTIWGNRASSGNIDIGIDFSTTAKDVTIRNGGTRGFDVGVGTVNKGVVLDRLASSDNGTGIAALGSTGLVIRRSVMTANGYGITVDANDTTITGNVVASSTLADGITVEGGNRNRVTNNVVSNSALNGIKVVNTPGVLVAGNTVTANFTGILAATRAIVRGNRSYANHNRGIEGTAQGSSFVGNRVIGNQSSGILLNADDLVVTGNVVSANQAEGINVDGSNPTVTANHAFGNSTDGLTVAGSDQVVAFNRSVGNGDNGIDLTVSGNSVAHDNAVTGNGFGSGSAPATHPGIRASVTGTFHAANNLAKSNDQHDCTPSTACTYPHTNLPLVHKDCGDVVDSSMRLMDPVGPCTGIGLRITKGGITVDLNGKTVSGNTADDVTGVAEPGINVIPATGVHIMNGYIRGFDDGILTVSGGVSSVIDGVVATGAVDSGFTIVGGNNTVRSSAAIANGTGNTELAGIRVRAGTFHVTGNVSVGNNTNGVYCEQGGHVFGVETCSGNVSRSNSQIGVRARAFTIASNVVYLNTGVGVSSEDQRHAAVAKNTAVRNAAGISGDFGPDVTNNLAMRSTTSGFSNLFASKIDGNTSVRNTSAGFDVSSNTFTNNTAVANGSPGGARATTSGGTRGYIVSGNRTFDNIGTGLIVNATAPHVRGNRSSGNNTDGIDTTGSSAAIVDKNVTLGNGFPTVNDIGEGINANDGTTGHNTSWGNEADVQCEPATIC